MQKILIVGDDKASQDFLCHAVETIGFISLKATDGRTAWQILTDNPDIACLITETSAPGLTGEELTKMVRAHQALSDLPILMLLGVKEVLCQQALSALGVSQILPKPVGVPELTASLASLVASE